MNFSPSATTTDKPRSFHFMDPFDGSHIDDLVTAMHVLHLAVRPTPAGLPEVAKTTSGPLILLSNPDHSERKACHVNKTAGPPA